MCFALRIAFIDVPSRTGAKDAVINEYQQVTFHGNLLFLALYVIVNGRYRAQGVGGDVRTHRTWHLRGALI